MIAARELFSGSMGVCALAKLTVLFPKFLTRHNSTAACPMATVNFCGVSLKKYVFFGPRCDFSPLPYVSLLRCTSAEIEINRAERNSLSFSVKYSYRGKKVINPEKGQSIIQILLQFFLKYPLLYIWYIIYAIWYMYIHIAIYQIYCNWINLNTWVSSMRAYVW